MIFIDPVGHTGGADDQSDSSWDKVWEWRSGSWYRNHENQTHVGKSHLHPNGFYFQTITTEALNYLGF